MSTDYGYVYCISNPCMPGIYKIGMTERTPNERLKEANRSNTWIPLPFIIEFSKYVSNPRQKESSIHKLLEKFSERVNQAREFFRINLKDVKLVFDIMEGDYYIEQPAEDGVIDKICIEEDIGASDSKPSSESSTPKQSYNDFVKLKHPEIKKQNPEWSPQEIIGEIGRIWSVQKTSAKDVGSE